MRIRISASIATLAIVALSACSNPPQRGAAPLPPVPTAVPAQTLSIVGVGDSLTFGEQADGMMGVASTNPLSALPGNVVPPTEENGFFALLWAKANGIALDPAKWNLDTALASPATSPLALILAPGLGSELVASTVSPPFAATHSPCDNINQSAFTFANLAGIRANPTSANWDVAVPGQSAHEALYMTAPLTGPAQSPACTYPTVPGDATSGGLQALVNGESTAFYPVLGSYYGHVPKLDQVDVAASLHAKLATVWLGSNDLLKFIFSNEASPITDSPQQMQADVTLAIQKLQQSGAKVVVANLPDVLKSAQFFQGGVQNVPSQSVFYYLQALSQGKISPASAQAIVGVLQADYGVSGNGYVTLSGLTVILSAVQSPAFNPTAPNALGLDPNGTGSGAGALYVPDALAGTAQQLNDAYNAAIAAAASATSVPVVDIHGLLSAAQTSGVTLPGAPTVYPRFGAGLLSWDGLHPSDMGYAAIADAFIQTIDTAYGMSIPPTTAAENAVIYAADPYRIPNI